MSTKFDCTDAPRGKDSGVAGGQRARAELYLGAQISTVYESKEFEIMTPTADYDLKTQQSAFVKFKRAHHITIRSNKEISVKFNATGNDAVTIDGSFEYHTLEVSEIFITTTQPNTKVKVLLG